MQHVVGTLKTHFGAGARHHFVAIHIVGGHVRAGIVTMPKSKEAPGVADERLEKRPVAGG